MIVVPGAVVGRTPNVPIEIEKGVDLSFDVLWWADEERTVPIAISEAVAKICDNDNVLVIDLAPTFEDNRVMFRLPGEVSRTIQTRGWASWELDVVAAVSGEHRKLAKGSVRFFEEVGP